MRFLCFLQPGTNSRSIFRDMIVGFQRAGHEALIVELAPIWDQYAKAGANKPAAMSAVTAEIARTVKSRRVDAALCMWGNALTTLMHMTDGAGTPRTVFDEIGVPLVCYWLDAPHWAQGESLHDVFGSPIFRGPSMRHIINNPGTAREMTDVLGFGRTLALPYGVDERVFSPRASTEPRYDLVAALGPGDPAPSPQVLAMLESDEPPVDELRRAAARRVAAALEKLIAEHPQRGLIHPVLEALLRSQIEHRHEPMFCRLQRFDPAGVAALVSHPRLYVRATMLVRAVEACERAFSISWLSRRFRVATFGSGDLGPWQCRATHLGELAYEAMADAYASGKAGLSVMRWQDDVGLNIKPFEISACARPCLCARRSGVDDLFRDGQEILVFDSLPHAAERLRSVCDSSATRHELGGRARARVEREHTWFARAGAIADWVP